MYLGRHGFTVKGVDGLGKRQKQDHFTISVAKDNFLLAVAASFDW